MTSYIVDMLVHLAVRRSVYRLIDSESEPDNDEIDEVIAVMQRGRGING